MRPIHVIAALAALGLGAQAAAGPTLDRVRAQD